MGTTRPPWHVMLKLGTCHARPSPAYVRQRSSVSCGVSSPSTGAILVSGARTVTVGGCAAKKIAALSSAWVIGMADLDVQVGRTDVFEGAAARFVPTAP